MDEDKSYLEHLLPLATELQERNGLSHPAMHDPDGHHNALGLRLGECWRELELLAAGRGYDVLRYAPAGDPLRRLVRQLVRLLYLVPDAAAPDDVAQLRAKDREYGGSWRRRGGPGAFFVTCRKWDRVAHQLTTHGGELAAALDADRRAEGILDDLGDLRRYLLLWESVARDHDAGHVGAF